MKMKIHPNFIIAALRIAGFLRGAIRRCPSWRWLFLWEGEYPYLGDLLTMVINHLLTGMILQERRCFLWRFFSVGFPGFPTKEDNDSQWAGKCLENN